MKDSAGYGGRWREVVLAGLLFDRHRDRREHPVSRAVGESFAGHLHPATGAGRPGDAGGAQVHRQYACDEVEVLGDLPPGHVGAAQTQAHLGQVVPGAARFAEAQKEMPPIPSRVMRHSRAEKNRRLVVPLAGVGQLRGRETVARADTIPAEARMEVTLRRQVAEKQLRPGDQVRLAAGVGQVSVVMARVAALAHVFREQGSEVEVQLAPSPIVAGFGHGENGREAFVASRRAGEADAEAAGERGRQIEVNFRAGVHAVPQAEARALLVRKKVVQQGVMRVFEGGQEKAAGDAVGYPVGLLGRAAREYCARYFGDEATGGRCRRRRLRFRAALAGK